MAAITQVRILVTATMFCCFVKETWLRLNFASNAIGTSDPMAQWIRRLTTDQEIAGSSPARVVAAIVLTIVLSLPQCACVHV